MAPILLVITIDTESDFQSEGWIKPDTITFRSVLEGIPQILQPLFKRFNSVPTYLISPEVLKDDACIKTLKSLEGKFELGTHLHGEYIEPYEKSSRPAGVYVYQCQYPADIEYAKLRNLTELFRKQFNYQPISFRAGRYGAGANTIQSLEKLGYLVDSSVSPYMVWRDNAGKKVVDFTRVPEQPYFPDKKQIAMLGESRILEVPISIIKPWWRSPLWLRPSYASTRQMIKVITTFQSRYANRQNPLVLNMMFHSMEVMPGLSPLNKTQEETDAFLKRMAEVLEYCLSHGVKFCTLSEIYPLFKGGRNGPK
jgi:hypothetical protein